MSLSVTVAISAGVFAIGITGVLATGLLVAGAQAAGAADAAALAAADLEFSVVITAETEPCELADRVARANGAELAYCERSDEPGEVRVRATIWVGLVNITRGARAGPPAS